MCCPEDGRLTLEERVVVVKSGYGHSSGEYNGRPVSRSQPLDTTTLSVKFYAFISCEIS
jgi:hypothetical protein